MDLYAQEYKLPAVGLSESDAYVFDEIYGPKDAYQRDRLIPLLKDGDVIEVGGHKGYFTLLAAKHANRVVVFEPSDQNFAFLRKNLALNHLHNVTPVKKAVAGDSQVRNLVVSSKTDARHSLIETDYSGCAGKVPVLCTSLADIIVDYSVLNIALLKVDCEGGEYDILMNLDPAIAQYIPRVLCEIHEAPTIPCTKADLVVRMRDLGYACDIYGQRKSGSMKLSMAWFSR